MFFNTQGSHLLISGKYSRIKPFRVQTNRINIYMVTVVAPYFEASQLGFPDDFDISYINLYDHLTPRLQELLFEIKKYKNANNFKFCWAKNGAVCLRKTETSTVIKLTSLDELNELRDSR